MKTFITAAISALAIALPGLGAAQDIPSRVTIASGAVSGGWYPMAGVLGELISEMWPQTDVTVTTGGGVENLPRVAAGLADTLASADATYTVFVPRDAAFTALDNANPAALGFLLGDPEGALTDVLLYHVIPGKVMASDLVDGETLTTLQGGELTVDVRTNGDVFINGARVVTADIPAKNGVIHVINQVLVPAGLELPEAPEVMSQLPSFQLRDQDDAEFTRESLEGQVW